MARKSPPERPDKWDDLHPHHGDGYVHVIAAGPMKQVIVNRVKRACDDLGIPLVADDPFDIESALRASALIIYDGDHLVMTNIVIAHAWQQHLPMIFLFEKDEYVDAIEMAYDWTETDTRGARDCTGAIEFDSSQTIADNVRNALIKLFRRLELATATHEHGWKLGEFAGVKEALRQSPAIPSSDWMRNQPALVMQVYLALVDAARMGMADAHTRADRVLGIAGYTTLPIPIEKIVKEHGITVRRVHLDNLSGRIKVTGGIAYIEVNNAEPPTRQNFTIAHEFGHWAMSHGLDCFRSASSLWVLRPNEDSANAFAADLLMPEPLVRNEFDNQQRQVRPLSEIVKSMAARCLVGEKAMRHRLRFLALIP